MQPGEVVLLVVVVVADTILVVHGKTTAAKIGIAFPSLFYITWGTPRSQPTLFNSFWMVLIATYHKLVLKSLGYPGSPTHELGDMLGVLVLSRSHVLDSGVERRIIT